MGVVWGLVRLTRLESIPLLTLPAVLGALANGASGLVALRVFVAVGLVHMGSCALNDTVDRNRDALDPRRRNRPMVSGAVTTPVALMMVGCLFCAGMAVSFTIPDMSRVWMSIFIVITALGNTVQKLSWRLPLFTDILWGTSIAITWLLLGTQGLVASAIFMFVWFFVLDMGASELKDLRQDEIVDTPTTARLLGVRMVNDNVRGSCTFYGLLGVCWTIMGYVVMIQVPKTSPLWLTVLLLVAASSGLLLRSVYSNKFTARVSLASLAVIFLAWLVAAAYSWDPWQFAVATGLCVVATLLATTLSAVAVRQSDRAQESSTGST